jgi:EAL domain-containing protein (putative c-di-GMP-specific phosphodiesterase class I)
MHFTAMLAFSLPVAIRYDGLVTALSILPAIAASASCVVLSQPSRDLKRPQVRALCMALGIGGMHYAGMEAVTVRADMYYDPGLFLLSIAAAYVFDEDLDASVKRSRKLCGELNLALSEKRLELHYQPIVAADGIRINGFEALARWHRSEQEWVSPAEFVPLAEETGLIVMLDTWAVRTAFEHLDCFVRETGWKNGFISVNVSAASLGDADFLTHLKSCVDEFGFRKGQIRLELTERMLVDDIDAMSERLKEIVSWGCDVLIDDFGTGYSSLAYLHRFPIRTVKIDRSFVANLDVEESTMPVIRIIHALAKTLHLSVIAEGVESRDQFDRLTELRIEEMQGYLFGRARPFDEVMRRLKQARDDELIATSSVVRQLVPRDAAG